MFDKFVDPFYKSKRWLALRQKVLKRDKYLCQISKRYGKRIDADTVHHIYPRDEYPEHQYCEWNLISLSNAMHNTLHDRTTKKLTQTGERLKNFIQIPPPFHKWK